MRGYALIALTALLTASCGLTPEGNALRNLAAQRGATVNDTGLDNAAWFICKAASVGSVQRRFGVSEEKAAAWRALCVTDAAASVIGPE